MDVVGAVKLGFKLAKALKEKKQQEPKQLPDAEGFANLKSAEPDKLD
jgi:hypothetical protein